ncbi:hypothetical protein Bbelb_035320 [Branchiostoma belcheri]|nr:hypothetical protein Bbelb_035320 [Branchiostoma belcheri]
MSYPEKAAFQLDRKAWENLKATQVDRQFTDPSWRGLVINGLKESNKACSFSPWNDTGTCEAEDLPGVMLRGLAFRCHPLFGKRPPAAGGDCLTSLTATTELEQDLMDISDSIGDLSLEMEGAMEPEEEPGTPAPGDDETTPPRRGRRNAAQGRRGRRRHTPALSTEEQRERIQRLRERRIERLQIIQFISGHPQTGLKH